MPPRRFDFPLMSKMFLLRTWAAFVGIIWGCLWVSIAEATIVRFQTSLGNIDVRLYDSRTPLTVANFLGYSNANRYDGSFIHRNPQDFVVQGGGFRFAAPSSVISIVDPANPDPPVLNEPGISNLRGTIAMAKLGNNPNSATSQWFFNWKDNSGPPPSLDTTNGGFTVFGRVVQGGMSVVDAINLLTKQDLDGLPNPGTFDEVPVRATTGDFVNRLVFISTIDVLNLPAGDYDFNGVVNAADYNVWRTNFGSTTAAEADGNGNGIVDVADYVIWRKLAAGSGAVLGAVPELSSAVLWLLGVLLFSLARWRRAG
jgi:peptidyl-prolyl cis-trans isomerase A (cyclophilin A)